MIKSVSIVLPYHYEHYEINQVAVLSWQHDGDEPNDLLVTGITEIDSKYNNDSIGAYKIDIHDGDKKNEILISRDTPGLQIKYGETL